MIKVHSEEKGSIAIMSAFSLMGVILMMGLVYDFGLWFTTRSELQNVADLAAMAGGRALGATYSGGSVDDGTQIVNVPRKSFSQQGQGLQLADTNLIQNAIVFAANQNFAGGIASTIGITDIVIGNWDSDTNNFSAIGFQNAVQVTARRDQNQNGPLAAFFGNLANLAGYNLRATATAALTPLQYVPPRNQAPPVTLPPGQIILPLGIDQSILPGDAFCGTSTVLSDDDANPSCWGWTTFNSPATQQNFDLIVAGFQTSPQTLAGFIGDGGTSYFWGGPWNQQAPGLQAIWEANDPPAFGNAWETLLPVYQNNGGICLNLTGQQIPIVGFVSVAIDGNTGDAQAQITFQCNVVGTGRSGDVNDPNLGFFRTLGSVPVLVQ